MNSFIPSLEDSRNITPSLDSIFEEVELWYLTQKYSDMIGYYSKPDLMEKSPRIDYFWGDEEKRMKLSNDLWTKILSFSQEQFTEFVTDYYPKYLLTLIEKEKVIDEEDMICILFTFLDLFLRDTPSKYRNAEYFFSHNKPLYDFCMQIFLHVQQEWNNRWEVYHAQEVERRIKPLQQLNQ